MNSNICNICGAEYEYINGRWQCPYCGSYKHDGTPDDEHILLCNAFQSLRAFEFVKAEDMFLDIIRKYPEQHEAYWGYVCSHYGIKVETDEDTGKKIPTCCFPTIESFANDKYFKKAVEYAPAEVRAWYVAQGEYIEYIRKRWLEIDKEEPKYDIFISFKDKDGDKNIPYDRNNVMMLYNYLKNDLNYNVFCSCMSLVGKDGKYGKEFEPYIFHALKTAKVMIVYSSSADYVSMPWVKNEWQRYMHMINSEEKREDSLVAVCNGFSPSSLPSALSKRQCFDATEPTCFPNISYYLERIVGKDNGENGKRKSSKKARVSETHKHEYKVKVVDATCVAKGYTLYECSCGDSYRDNYTDLVDHKYKFSKKVDPGCDTAGYTERKCTVCGERLRDPIQPLGHSFSKWNETKHPTCTEPGEKQRKCTVCGVSERGVVSPTGHEFGPWSYTSHGMQKRKCKNCGKTETEQTPYEIEKRRKRRKKVFSFIAVVLVIAALIYAVILSLPWLKQQEWFNNVTEGFSSMVSSLGKHDITFNANGGSGSMDSISVNNNRGVILPENTFTKPGYSFGGWSLSPDGKKEYSNKAHFLAGSKDVTLYAIWNPNRYTVSFDANGGLGYTSMVFGDAYGTVALSLNRFSKTYHTFKGWSTTPNGEVEYEDGAEYTIGIDNVTLYAVWEANNYEITFDANGGSDSMDSISVRYGESVSLPSCSFTRDKYTFAGWSLTSGGEVEYEDSAEYTLTRNAVTLYAIWEANSYDITFDANGGSGSMDSISVKYGGSIYLPENKFTKPGYSFGGWSLSPYGEKKYSNKAYYSGGGIDVTLYAIWNPNRYSISFDDNGGSGYMSNVYGDAYETVTLSLNRFTKTYHTFKGWSTTPDGEVEYEDGAEYTIGIDNVTLYAVWEANSYDITFDANGGSGSMDSISVRYGESISLPICSLTRDEYTFAGWSLTSGGEVEYENSAEYTMGHKAVTLYAVWKYQDLTPYSDGLDFVLGINGKYMVIGIGKCTDSQLIIPPTHNGIVVDSIFKEAFSGCKSINSVIIGDNVESIGDNAFSSCINVESVAIPKGTINISSSAFIGCNKLENIEVDATNANYKSIDGNLYSSDGKILLFYAPGKKDSEFTIPNGVTAIGDNAFYDCDNLTSVIFPGSVESIGSQAFYLCDKLTNVVINYGVKSIGGSAFAFCDELTNVTIPNSVTEIGFLAFGHCEKLSKIIIPDSVESIDSFAFSGCRGLEEVVISSNLKSLSSWMFDSCTSLKSITIPESVESIGTEAFNGCSALESITIPSSVTTIRSDAFYGCKSLKSVVIEGDGSWIMKKSGEANITLQPPFDPSSISVYITSIYSEYAWYREMNVI